jgi:hypothetical protein
MQLARLGERKRPELRLLFAIPNAGAGAQSGQAGKMKAEGVKRGVPDLHLPVARNGYHGLFIEMKYGKGTPSPEQKEWIADLREEGYRVVPGWRGGKDAFISPETCKEWYVVP